ncbi:MAG: S41 family peptidase [Pseudomonadales bacterium]
MRNNGGRSNEFSDHLIAWFAAEPFRFSDCFEIKVSEAAIASNQERHEAQETGAGVLSTTLAAANEDGSPGQVTDFSIELAAPRRVQRFENPMYMLINRHSYSNAVSVAAIGQDYGFAKILGEPTADLANTYGGMEQFTLPSTGTSVGFPQARILRPSRDLDADTVLPDLFIEPPLAPSTDIVLERAIDAIADLESI